MISYMKPTGKYPSKRPGAAGAGPDANPATGSTMQGKLVLLTLTFPRVRIIWSSSPYATVNIFNDLESNACEPDYHAAAAAGAEEGPEAGAGANPVAEELLRTISGIMARNVKYVTGKVSSVCGLCNLLVDEIKGLLGTGPGKACWDFLHWGERKNRWT